MEQRKLGVLLSTPASHPNIDTVVSLCQEALAAQVDVYLYLIDEGVGNLRDPRLESLSTAGMKFYVCAYGCQRHGVSTADLPKGATLCGLVVLGNMLTACDRFLAFN